MGTATSQIIIHHCTTGDGSGTLKAFTRLSSRARYLAVCKGELPHDAMYALCIAIFQHLDCGRIRLGLP